MEFMRLSGKLILLCLFSVHSGMVLRGQNLEKVG